MAEKKAEFEKRYYTFEAFAEKRDDGSAKISGRPIVYNSPTDIGGMFREIIMPGALDGADLRDVPLLVNHNDRMIPVARSRRNNGNSTIFRVDSERWEGLETDYPTRYIDKFSVIREISAVTFPAYASTEINTRGKEALESARRAVDTAQQQRDKSPEGDDTKLALQKAKLKLY